MAGLDRGLFLQKRVSTTLIPVDLPGGDQVFLRPASAKVYREYRRSMRDKDGMPIPERQSFGDELLVSRLLVSPDGTPMFTEEQVVNGVLDDIDMTSLAPIIRKSYVVVGVNEDDEGRAKNSSTTESTEPS